MNLARERRQSWVLVAHVVNLANGEEWIEVRGGRAGEAKTRSFRPDLIYAHGAVEGSRLVGSRLVDAPRLDLACADIVNRVGLARDQDEQAGNRRDEREDEVVRAHADRRGECPGDHHAEWGDAE